jgi:hypothetical protein
MVSENHTDIRGTQHPDYYNREFIAKNFDLRVRQTPYIQEKEQLEYEQK